MGRQQDLRRTITAQLIEAIERGTVPWRRPWKLSANSGAPSNVVSRRPYRGVNPFILQLSADSHGFQSRYWGTFKQWNDLGCNVRKGQKGTRITFSTPLERTSHDKKGEEHKSRFWILREFIVFNAEQCAGTDRFHVSEEPVSREQLDERFDAAQRVVDATGAEIHHGGDRAFYSPSTDSIHMPHRTSFPPEGYFETLFHELAHWTEHSGRTNWDRSKPGNTYAAGELRAELAACYLSNEVGLPCQQGADHHAAYLAHWLGEMRQDSSFIFRVSAEAGRATDFVLTSSRDCSSLTEQEAVAT
jgi:antirestriction protein ArdC